MFEVYCSVFVLICFGSLRLNVSLMYCVLDCCVMCRVVLFLFRHNLIYVCYLTFVCSVLVVFGVLVLLCLRDLVPQTVCMV